MVLELVGYVSEHWAVFLSGRGSGALEVRLEVEDHQNAMKMQANEVTGADSLSRFSFMVGFINFIRLVAEPGSPAAAQFLC